MYTQKVKRLDHFQRTCPNPNEPIDQIIDKISLDTRPYHRKIKVAPKIKNYAKVSFLKADDYVQ